jgi:hypothetical protein
MQCGLTAYVFHGNGGRLGTDHTTQPIQVHQTIPTVIGYTVQDMKQRNLFVDILLQKTRSFNIHQLLNLPYAYDTQL